MGADKNSSPKRELSLYPKFTTKNSHMSLPRSCSHYGPTNPGNKPQTIPKRKHESRSKRLSNPAQCQADGPRAWGGQSADTGRMVREPGADSPRTLGRRSVNCNITTRHALQHADGPYLVHGQTASNWCRADGPRHPGGRSAKHLPAENS
jgi:hypothetical protein